MKEYEVNFSLIFDSDEQINAASLLGDLNLQIIGANQINIYGFVLLRKRCFERTELNSVIFDRANFFE